MDPKEKHPRNNLTTRQLSRGEAPLSSGSAVTSKELGEVLDFNADTNTYRVLTRGVMGDSTHPSGRLLQGIPRKVETPGVVAALSIGAIVIVDYSLGFPYIDGTLNVIASRPQTEDAVLDTSSIGGDTSIADPIDKTTQDGQGYYRDPSQPRDIVSGDWMVTSDDGNRVGVLRGGYNVIDGGPGTKSKVETFGERDLVRITSEDFELFTGFGVLRIINAEGRCGLTFRGAADQLNESGGDEEQWTFKLDIGDDGDFFNLEVNTADGATAGKFHITPDGKITLVGAQGVDILAGDKTPSYREFGSDLITRILGKVLSTTEGSVTEKIRGSRTTTVSETDNRMVGHNNELSANNHQIENIGGNQYTTITGGSPLEATPANIAIEEHVLNGSYHLELGNPLKGSNPAAMAGMTVAVNNGHIVLGQNPDPLAIPAALATVSLNTLLPNSVGLGGTANPLSSNPALFHATKYEPLVTLLMTMMAVFDAHTHVPPIGGIPVALMTPTLSPMLPTIMSARVVIGA